MRLVGLGRDHEKPMSQEDMKMEIMFRSEVGSVEDPMHEFSDDTVAKVLDAMGLGDSTIKSEDNDRSNLDSRL